MSAVYIVSVIQGIGKRNSQKDFCGISPACAAQKETDRLFIAVSDGNLPDGKLASQIVVNEAVQRYESLSTDRYTGETLKDMLNEENVKVWEAVGGNGYATALLSYFDDEGVVWASAGDTRIYFYRDRILGQWNEDHNHGARLEATAHSDNRPTEFVSRNEKRHFLYSYLGGEKIERICFSNAPFQLASGDKVLLATDGVTQALSDEELKKHLSLPIYRASAKLKKSIEKKKLTDQDNYLAVIIERI